MGIQNFGRVRTAHAGCYRATRLPAPGKLLLVLNLIAVALHLAFPAKFSLLDALVATNALGLISIWFNCRRMPSASQLSESRLRLLQAQFEPHFLFNTLGAVQQLAHTECARASLDDMRTEQVPIEAGLALVEAYLKVMKTRWASRLQFNLSLPPSLAGVRIPSMLVLTLVENAIKHGIEPALRGAGDYLLKPMEQARLALTIARIRSKLHTPPREKLHWIKATLGKQIKLIDMNEILFFQSDTKYTRVVLADYEALIRIPIKHLLGGLDENQFWQIHRNAVVNVKAIAPGRTASTPSACR